MSKYTAWRANRPKFSFHLDRKVMRITAILAILCLLIMIISTGVGSLWVNPWEVILSVFGHGEPMHNVIVNQLRLPRIVIAVLVGAALAVAGAVLQGIVRNPLASPDVTGITDGASFGAVLFLFMFTDTISIRWMPVAAILSAFMVTGILYLLSWRNGVAPLRLVLIGTGLSAAFKSLSYMFIIASPFMLAVKSVTFMTGSIYGVSWDKDVLTLLPWVGILLPLTWLLSRHMNVQALGDDVANSAGSNVQRGRIVLLLLSVALAGSAVAIGGAISFIGLMAPHIARKMVGPAFGGLLPVSALLGAIILLVADLVARTAFYPKDIAAGVFTAVIGAPFFLYMLYRQRNS